MDCQGRTETNDERFLRAPSVLEAYARDIDKYGKPMDSGLGPYLRFVAKMIEERKEWLVELRSWMIDNDYECGEAGSNIYNDIQKMIGNYD